MQLNVLVDNNTLIEQYYFGEPGLSFFIEEEGNKILFDTGYSGVFMRNAEKMGIDLKNIQYLVLSHGHLDHTWGVSSLIETMSANISQDKKIKLVTHPFSLCLKSDEGEQIGCRHTQSELKKCFDVTFSKAPLWISEKLVYLGQIERTNNFENQEPIGTTIIDGCDQEDYILDDSALAYKAENGLVIITGCSHSGICNIIEYAKNVCGEERILDIIGGFHLLNPSEEQLTCTLEYLRKVQPNQVHACHCTDLNSKVALAGVVTLKEVGVGLTLKFE